MVHILKGTQFYRMFIALVLYVRKFGYEGARNVSDDAGYVENSASPTPKFGA